MSGRARHAAPRRRRPVVVAVLLAALAAGGLWCATSRPAVAEPAHVGQTGPQEVECANDDGFMGDLFAFLDDALFFKDFSDKRSGGTHKETWTPPADLPDDVRSWLRDEIVNHKECSLIGATVLPRCDGSGKGQDGNELLPGTCVGAFPTTSYDLTFERSDWNDLDFFPDLLGYVMIFAFDVASLIISGAIWLIGYALTWRVADGVELPASMAHSFDQQVVGPLQLGDLAWLVLVVWVAFAVLRGRTAVGAAELVLSVVMAMLAVVVVKDVTSRDGSYLARAVAVMDRVSAGVLLAGSGEDPRWDDAEVDVSTAVEPLQRSLHVAFVDSAYDRLNWGTAVGLTSDDEATRAARGIDVPQACIEAKEHILRIQDPDPEWAARHMERAGPDCRRLAEFNRRPTSERTLASILNLLGALVLVALFGLLAFTLLVSKFTLTLIFAATPFAAVAAVFPGVARRGAWVWLGAILQVYVVVIGSAGLLAVLLVSVESTLDTVMGVNLVQRWVLVLVVLATMFVLRRRLLAASRTIAGKFADSLTRLSLHNSGYRGDAVGTNLLAPEDYAGRSFTTRWIERRVARRSLNNLEIMERTRERGNVYYEQKIPLDTGTPDKPRTRHEAKHRRRRRRTRPDDGNPPRPKSYRRRHGGRPGGPKHAADGNAGRAQLVRRRPPAPVPDGADRQHPEPDGSGGGAGGGGGGGAARGGDRALAVTLKMRAPRSLLRHPAGALSDRARLWRNRRELRGIIRTARKTRHRWP